jgi:hypothetical protein
MGSQTVYIPVESSEREAICELFRLTVDYATYMEGVGCEFDTLACCEGTNTTLLDEFADRCGMRDVCGRDNNTVIMDVTLVLLLLLFVVVGFRPDPGPFHESMRRDIEEEMPPIPESMWQQSFCAPAPFNESMRRDIEEEMRAPPITESMRRDIEEEMRASPITESTPFAKFL